MKNKSKTDESSVGSKTKVVNLSSDAAFKLSLLSFIFGKSQRKIAEDLLTKAIDAEFVKNNDLIKEKLFN